MQFSKSSTTMVSASSAAGVEALLRFALAVEAVDVRRGLFTAGRGFPTSTAVG